MSGKKIDLGLTGYDELFMDDKGRAEAKLPRIYDIPLSEIDDFPDHPFQVRMDEDMEQLVESVKERGIHAAPPKLVVGLRFHCVIRRYQCHRGHRHCLRAGGFPIL